MKVNDIVSYLFTLSPAYMQEEWDNVGLICGHADAEVQRVLVALDASPEVLREAKEKDCQMVVSHHPMIFGGIKQICDSTVTGKNILFAIENGIACVNMHTNLDCAAGGVNDVLAQKLGLRNCVLASPRGTDDNGMEYGYVRYGTVDEMSLADFAAVVKEKLYCHGLRYADGGRPVCKVAVGGGACGDEIAAVLAAGCDTFVTADLKYHQFCDARALGLNLIDAGHYQTEVSVCEYLQKMLSVRFEGLKVFLSELQDDSIHFLC